MTPATRPSSLPAPTLAAHQQKHMPHSHGRTSTHIFSNPFSQPHLHPIWISFSTTTRARYASTPHPLARRLPSAYPPTRVRHASRAPRLAARWPHASATIPRLSTLADDHLGVLRSRTHLLALSPYYQDDHPALAGDLTLSYGDSTNDYVALDRFGRIVNQTWKLNGTAIDSYAYGYNADFNRTDAGNLLAPADPLRPISTKPTPMTPSAIAWARRLTCGGDAGAARFPTVPAIGRLGPRMERYCRILAAGGWEAVGGAALIRIVESFLGERRERGGISPRLVYNRQQPSLVKASCQRCRKVTNRKPGSPGDKALKRQSGRRTVSMLQGVRTYLSEHMGLSAVALLMLIGGAAWFIWHGASGGNPAGTVMDYFYDEESHEVVVRGASEIAPLIGKSGQPTLVRAVYYTEGGDGVRKLAYLEKYDEPTKAALERQVHQGSGDPGGGMMPGNGKLVRGPEEGAKWVPAFSEQGTAVMNRMYEGVADRSQVRLVSPN